MTNFSFLLNLILEPNAWRNASRKPLREDHLERNALAALRAIPLESMRRYWMTTLVCWLRVLTASAKLALPPHRSIQFLDAYS